MSVNVKLCCCNYSYKGTVGLLEGEKWMKIQGGEDLLIMGYIVFYVS